MATFIDFPDEVKAKAPHLEPAQEGLLRSSNVHEEVIMAFRCKDVLSRAAIVALDTTEGLIETATAFGIKAKNGTFEHEREMAKLIAAWQQGRIQNETKVKVDAISKAHGEPVSMPPEDYEVLLTAFKEKHGKIHDSKLPAQSYFESFQDKLQEGGLKPETLAQVVSLSEEEAFEASKPEAPKNFAIHLDSTLTMQSQRRYLSEMTTSIEGLRTKYAVMENPWLLAKMSTPGRHLFADVHERTWTKFLDLLLSNENFLCNRHTQGGQKVVAPDSNACLEFEFQLRKQAFKLIRETRLPIGEALQSAYNDPQHRMTHWISLLTIANGQEEHESQEVAGLKRRLAAVEKALGRSAKAQKNCSSSRIC